MKELESQFHRLAGKGVPDMLGTELLKKMDAIEIQNRESAGGGARQSRLRYVTKVRSLESQNRWSTKELPDMPDMTF